MKKLSILSALLLSATFAFAQDLSFGARGGLNLASVSASTGSGESKSVRPSINLGVYGLYSLNEKMGLQAELFYSGEGVKDKYNDGYGTTYNSTIRLNYLNLPVFFKYNIVKGLYVMAGPQLSFKLAAKTKTSSGGTTVISTIDGAKAVNVALVPLVGYDFGKFTANLRYQIGLTNVVDTNGNGSAKSNVFAITVGYKIFNLKK